MEQAKASMCSVVVSMITFFLICFADHLIAIDQPDAVYYSINRKILFEISERDMKTFPIRWIVASAKEGAPVFFDSSMSQTIFSTTFIQRFEVLAKEKANLQVKELDKSSPRNGWMKMKDLIYLPQAFKDEKNGVYQKVVFTHMEEHIKIGEIGDIILYKSPSETIFLERRSMGTLRIAYVYAWENTTYDDSEFVLIGNYPSIEGVLTDPTAFKKAIYGWCKRDKVFPWNSRIALIPNKNAKFPSYIFHSGPMLANFYSYAQTNSVPDSKSLLTYDSWRLWIKFKWPFFLQGKLRSGNQEYLRLICQTGVEQSDVRDPVPIEFIQREIEYLKLNSKKVDIVFLIDATQSMRPYIEGVAVIVKNVMDELKKNSSIDQLKFGAAVYRDYVDREKKFEIQPLNENIDSLRKDLNKWAQNANSHPDDNGEAAYPEALFNGIEESVKRSGFGEYNTKCLIVIGDAGNHSRGNDNYSRETVGNILATHRINCMMVKVKHGLVGGDSERIAMELFKIDSEGVRRSYLRKYIESANAHNNRYSEADILGLFLTDEIENPFILKNQLLNQYSKQISYSVNKLIEFYQKLIEGAPIEVPSSGTLKKDKSDTDIQKNQLIVNPIVFENLKKRFGDDFPKVLEELKQKRAFLMKFGYAKEFDPRSTNIPQFKNVYLLRRSEVGKIIQALDLTYKQLKPGTVKNLWKVLVERIYGEECDPDRTYNEYARMHDGITYKNLSVLFDKTQEQISRLNSNNFEIIEREVISVKMRLENLMTDKTNERFFGSMDDPYIFLYDEEMP